MRENVVYDLESPYSHHRFSQFVELSRVPESRRAQHFLDKELMGAERKARQSVKLEISDERLRDVLVRSSAS